MVEIMAHQWWVLADRRGIVIGSVNGFLYRIRVYSSSFCECFGQEVKLFKYLINFTIGTEEGIKLYL